MPLSEDEQRILQEIEKNFYDSDPAFAREVSAASGTRTAARNVKLSAFAFVVGLIVVITSFTSSSAVAFAGFLVMVGAAFSFQHFARRLELPAWAERRPAINNDIDELRRRMRGRFQRDGDSNDEPS